MFIMSQGVKLCCNKLIILCGICEIYTNGLKGRRWGEGVKVVERVNKDSI